MDNPAAVPPGRIKLIPYFRIIWGAKEVIRGNWYLGLIGLHTKGYPRELWIYLSMRGFLRWSAGTLIVTYFAGAAALAWFYGRNPYNQITYTDLILPTRWSELRTMRGQANIDEGLAKLKAKQYGAAFMLLNQGMARKPDNISARLVVAQMYTSMGYLNRAMQVYRDGLPYAGEQRRFIAAAIQLAEYMEDYELVLALVKEAEAGVPANSLSLRTLLQEKRILSYEKLGRYDEIEALWTASQTKPTMRLNAAHLRALAATGKAEEAIAALEAKPDQYGLLREPWELLLELSQNAKSDLNARRALDALIELEPVRYRFYIKRIAYLVETGAVQEAQSQIGSYFLRFGADSVAVVMLLKGIEPYPTREAVDRVWNEIRAAGQVGPAAYMTYVQNLIHLGALYEAQQQYTLARIEIERTRYRDDGWVEGTGNLLELMKADSPSARSLLRNYVTSNPLSPEAFRILLGNLLRVGRTDAAREMAILAQNRFPAIRNLPADALAVSTPIIAESNNKPREPNVVPLMEAREELAALEAAITANQWEKALIHIVKVEKSPLGREMADQLLYRRLIIHGHLSNQTELSWYMRRLMSSGRVDPSRIRDLASNLYRQAHMDSALTILREVLRRYPDAKWATDQLHIWNTEIKAAELKPVPLDRE